MLFPVYFFYKKSCDSFFFFFCMLGTHNCFAINFFILHEAISFVFFPIFFCSLRFIIFFSVYFFIF
ncbi:hypothetical protein BY996DRAFT_6915958 [Phakopsora pachyrhizi]|nr:hypothetical protein BY996DRAFT_6915958 [Phakopsora pachyrhizi]